MDALSLLIAKKIGSGGGSVPEYEGPYTVTPSESAQTLETAGLKMTDDVTVNPIPSSYVQPTGTKQITQNGTGIDVAAFASVDVNVSGGSTADVPMKDVNFYDYDGTRLYSYTASEFLALSAMPANPTHSGLTAKGWNWTLADAQEEVGAIGGLDIGQLYITDDGCTRIYINLDDPLSLSISFNVGDGSYNIDWGDGTRETSVAGDLSHTYSNVGEYLISLDSSGDGYYIKQLSSAAVKKVEFGGNVSFGSNAFKDCINLETITTPLSTRFAASPAQNFFSNCFRLKCIIYPPNVVMPTAASASTFSSCYSVKCLSLSKQSNSTLRSSEFSSLLNLLSLSVPRGYVVGASQNTTSVFSGSKNLSKVRFCSKIFGNYTFSNCSNLKEFYFMEKSSVPTINTSGNFNNVPSTCKFFIPFEKLAAYLTATNYPAPATYTYIGFATYANGATLPTQDTTAAYNVVWYASKADAIAQTNPITVGNGNEIYCRYTAV